MNIARWGCCIQLRPVPSGAVCPRIAPYGIVRRVGYAGGISDEWEGNLSVFVRPATTESGMRPWIGGRRLPITSRTGQLLVIVVVIGIAFALRAYHLGHFSLWLDETITYSVASHPYGAILDARGVERDHVVTQYVIAHFGIILHMDAHEWLLRLPSMLFGVATVAAIWLLGNALFGRATAAVAALFAALWPSLILSSQEYREYSLFALLAALSVFALFRALRTHGTVWWIAFTLALLLSMETHFLTLLQIAAYGLYIACWICLDAWSVWKYMRNARSVWGGIRPICAASAGVGAVIATAFIPISLMLGQYLQWYPWGRTSRLSAPLPEMLQRFFGAQLGLGEHTRLAITAGFALIGLVWTTRTHPRVGLFALFWYGVPLTLLIASNAGKLFLTAERYLVFLLVVHIVFIALGVVVVGKYIGRALERFTPQIGRMRNVPGEAFGVCVVVALFVAMLIPTIPQIYQKDPKPIPMDLRAAYRSVSTRMAPNDILLESNLSPSYSVHWFPFYNSYYLRPVVRPRAIQTVLVTEDGSPSVSPQIADTRGHVWVLVTLDTPQMDRLIEETRGVFDTRCFQHICALQFTDVGDPSARTGITRYLRAIAPFSPETSRALLTILQESRAEPADDLTTGDEAIGT